MAPVKKKVAGTAKAGKDDRRTISSSANIPTKKTQRSESSGAGFLSKKEEKQPKEKLHGKGKGDAASEASTPAASKSMKKTSVKRRKVDGSLTSTDAGATPKSTNVDHTRMKDELLKALSTAHDTISTAGQGDLDAGALPRGGGSSLTAIEYKRAVEEAKEEATKDAQKEAQHAQKKRKRQAAMLDDGGLMLEGDGADDAADPLSTTATETATDALLAGSTSVEPLHYTNITEGTLVLGVIKAVQDDTLLLSLPHNLQALVPRLGLPQEVQKMLDVIDPVSSSDGAIRRDNEANMDESSDDDVEVNDEEDDDDNDNEEEEDAAMAGFSLSTLFANGQMVQCRILGSAAEPKKGQKQALLASIDPTEVNKGLDAAVGHSPWQAVVESVQDHGYRLRFHCKNATFGFMSFRAAAAAAAPEMHLRVGQLVTVAIESIKNGIAMCLPFATPQTATTEGRYEAIHQAVAMDQLRPGCLVQALLLKESADQNGYHCRIAGLFDAAVTRQHLPQQQELKIGTKVKMRILYIELSHQRIGLTMLPALMAMPAQLDTSTWPAIGSIWRDSEVLRLQPKHGVHLHLPGASFTGYLHASRVKDAPPTTSSSASLSSSTSSTPKPGATVDVISTTFEVGKKVPQCRVVAHSYMDGIVQVSTQASTLSLPFLRVEDAIPGTVCDGTILKVVDGKTAAAGHQEGLLLDIGGTHGWVSKLHLADVMLTKNMIGKKFKVGAKVKCRVLSRHPQRRRLYLTVRPGLVKYKQPIIASLADVQIGMTTKGVITSMCSFGVFVTFFGDITALCHKSEMSAAFVKDPTVGWSVGQSVTCRVIKQDANGIRVSFKDPEGDLASTTTSTSTSTATTTDVLATLVHRRCAMTVERADKKMVYGHALIDGHTVPLRLSVTHLSDFLPTAPAYHKRTLGAGDHVEVLTMDLSRPTDAQRTAFLWVTAKPSILHQAQRSFTQAAAAAPATQKETGDEMASTVFAYVRQLTEFGALIKFPFNGSFMEAFVAKHNLSKVYVTKPQNHLSMDQTVVATLLPLSSTLTSTKASSDSAMEEGTAMAVDEPNSKEGTQPVKPKTVQRQATMKVEPSAPLCHVYLQSVFASQPAVATAAEANVGQKEIKEASYVAHLGHLIEGVCTEQRAYATLFQIKASNAHPFGGWTGVMTKEHGAAAATDDVPQPGSSASLVVLDMQPQKRILDLSLRLVDACLSDSKQKTTTTAAKKPNKKGGRSETAEVVLVKEDYVVARSLQEPNAALQLYYATSKTFNDRQKLFEKVRLWDKIDVLPLAVAPISIAATAAAEEEDEEKSERRFAYCLPAKGSTTTSSPEKAASKEATASKPLPSIGDTVSVRIKSIKALQLNCEIVAPAAVAGVQGRLHLAELSAPKETFAMNQIVDGVTVLGIRDTTSYGWLPISRQHLHRAVLDFSQRRTSPAREAILRTKEPLAHYPSASAAPPAGVYRAVVLQVTPAYLLAALNCQQRVKVPAVGYSFDPVSHTVKQYKVGETVRLCVNETTKPTTAVRLDNNNDDNDNDNALTGRLLAAAPAPQDVASFVLGKITKINEGGVLATLADGTCGRCHVCDVITPYRKDWAAAANLTLGGLRVFRRLNVPSNDERMEKARSGLVTLSLLPDAELSQDAVPTEGAVLDGYVHHISERNGIFVSLTRSLYGRVQIKHLSDDFVKQWQETVEMGQVVRVKVLSFDPLTAHCELSMRRSDIDPTFVSTKDAAQQAKRANLGVDAVVAGRIKSLQTYGIFVALDAPFDGITALCHRTNVSDALSNDNTATTTTTAAPITMASLFAVGDRVKALVLKNDLDTKRVSISLKTSDVLAHLSNETPSLQTTVSAAAADKANHDNEEEEEDCMDEDDIVIQDSDDDDDNDEDEDEDDALPDMRFPVDTASAEALFASAIKSVSSSPLTATAGQRPAGNSDGKHSGATENGKSAKEEMDTYEKLLLASPNSSYLWLKLVALAHKWESMAAARAVVDRALATIAYKEEKEKMNIWTGLLNLELLSGSMTSFEDAFRRACGLTDPKKMWLQAGVILEQHQRHDYLATFYDDMVKKYKQSAKIWLQVAQYHYRQEQIEKARALMQRYVKVLNKFAQCEYKFGQPERGRTLLEGIVAKYPKRTDIWSVYLDMEMRHNQSDPHWRHLRHLFERLIAFTFSSKKMKFFFKRYLEFEMNQGGNQPAKVAHVKRKAEEYVQRQRED